MALRLIQSGYGDKRDLKAVAPKREEATLDFEARWRMLGRRVHKDEAYTKQDFTYGVHYEGERVSKYNEAPYHSNVIAHPKRCFPYAVEQHMSLPIDRLWETRADFYATVQKNTLKYALEFEGDYQIPKPTYYKIQFSIEKGVEKEYNFSDFFDKAEKIGEGRWEKSGKAVIDMTNSNGFSGIFGTVDEIKDIKNYVAEFDFTAQFAKGTQGTIETLGPTIKVARSPITSRPDEKGFLQAPGADDDIIGFIFRAKDKNNFYCMLVEGERRIFPGTRAGNLTGMKLSDNYIDFSKNNKNSPGLPNFLSLDDGTPIAKSQWVESITGDKIEEKFTHWDKLGSGYVPRNPGKGAWESFVKNSGWGLQHKQIYKVTNGVFSKVDVQCLNNTGFLLDSNRSNNIGDGEGPKHKVIVTTMGNNVTISMNDRPGAEQYTAFSFQTDWDEGGIGAMNVSQAVVFNDIKVKRVDSLIGTLPKDDWDELESGETVLAENATEYVKNHPDYLPQLEDAGIEAGGETIISIMGIDKEGDSSNIIAESNTGKITIKTKFTREPYSGRLPESGWYEHDGFVGGSYQPEFTHFPNIADALKQHTEAKGMVDFNADSIVGVVETPEYGRVTTNFAFVAISNNAWDAGQQYHEYHYKCGTQGLTPDNYDEATCVNAFTDITALTRIEENAFFNKREDWDKSSFIKEYQVTKPIAQNKSAGPPEDALETNPNTDCFIPNPNKKEPEFEECDIDFIFDGKALCLWSCEFPIDIQTKNFTDCIYAYEGERTFDPFSEFTPNPWTHYKLFLDMDFFKEEHDSVRVSGDQVFTNIAVGSTLYFETNEHYYSSFDDEIKNNGVITSVEDVAIKIPDFPYSYVDPIFYEPVDLNYNIEEVHYLLDAWGNHEDVKIRLVTDKTKRDGTIEVDAEKVTTQGLIEYSKYAHEVEKGNHQKAVHGRKDMPILKVEDKRYQELDSRFFIEISCIKKETRYKWNSGEMKQEASVNGLEPLRGRHEGKTDYGPVDLNTIFIPDDIDRNTLSKPIVVINNDKVNYRIENDQLYFYSNYKDQFEWYSPWIGKFDYIKGVLKADTIGFIEAKRMSLPLFYNEAKKESSVIVDHIEVETTSPFILLRLSRPINDLLHMINERNTSESVSFIAKVKDSYPRDWRPLVQSGYYYINEKEYYLYSNRGRHISNDVMSVKRIYNKLFADGAPILVHHDGKWLRKSQFIKDKTLGHVYEQEEIGKGFDRIYFDFSDIDYSSLSIIIDNNQLPSSEFSIKGEYVLLSQPLAYGKKALIKYSIEESFYVEMRNLFYDKKEEMFSVHLHPKLTNNIAETSIYYEQEGSLPYYRSEIKSNPILNRHGKGFLYINNNEKLIPTRIDVRETKKFIDQEWQEKVSIITTVYDQNDNPLENETIDIYVDDEFITTKKTNDSGEIYSVLKPNENVDIINVRCKHATENVEGRTVILKKKGIARINKIVRVFTDNTILLKNSPNQNKYSVQVLNKDLMPLAGELVNIKYYDNSGNELQATLSTNALGIASSTLNLLAMTGERITVEASVTNLSGQISKSKTYARLVN